MSDHAPLRIPRLALLLLCWAFGVVGASISLNALIKYVLHPCMSDFQFRAAFKASIENGLASTTWHPMVLSSTSIYMVRNSIGPGITDLDLRSIDIFSIGGVLAGGCALLAILSALYLFCTFFRVRDNYTFLQVQAWSTYFCAIWLLATLIPFDLLFATGEAVVSASLNGISLSQNVIKDAEGALGISPLYRSRSYCICASLSAFPRH